MDAIHIESHLAISLCCLHRRSEINEPVLMVLAVLAQPAAIGAEDLVVAVNCVRPLPAIGTAFAFRQRRHADVYGQAGLCGFAYHGRHVGFYLNQRHIQENVIGTAMINTP